MQPFPLSGEIPRETVIPERFLGVSGSALDFSKVDSAYFVRNSLIFRLIIFKVPVPYFKYLFIREREPVVHFSLLSESPVIPW